MILGQPRMSSFLRLWAAFFKCFRQLSLCKNVSVKATTNDMDKLLGHVQYQESTPQTMLVTAETFCTKSCTYECTYVRTVRVYACTHYYARIQYTKLSTYVTCITAANLLLK